MDPDTIRLFAGRACLVVETYDGVRQPFYRSTGRNSGQAALPGDRSADHDAAANVLETCADDLDALRAMVAAKPPASADTDALREAISECASIIRPEIYHEDPDAMHALHELEGFGCKLCDALDASRSECERLRQALEKRGKELLAEMQAKAELKADIGRRITKDAAAAPAIECAANLLREEGYNDEADELEALL